MICQFVVIITDFERVHNARCISCVRTLKFKRNHFEIVYEHKSITVEISIFGWNICNSKSLAETLIYVEPKTLASHGIHSSRRLIFSQSYFFVSEEVGATVEKVQNKPTFGTRWIWLCFLLHYCTTFTKFYTGYH